jgi:hypothetical protein
LAKCESKGCAPGIEFETQTRDGRGTIQCTVTAHDNQIYHFINIVNKRGKNLTVDVKGFTHSNPHILEFKHKTPRSIKKREWETPQIFVRARTKKFGTYSGNEATVVSVSTTHGEETISTSFTYTPQDEAAYPPVELSFPVDY